MKQLVYAEIETVTEEMRGDKKVLIVSDGALFLVTTLEYSKHFFEEFHEVTKKAIDVYQIVVKDGKVSSELFQQKY